MSNITMSLNELRKIIRETLAEYLSEAGKDKDEKMDETTPKGYEKIVKGLKKAKGVKNPYAVAYSMKKKGIKPQK